MDKQFSKSDMEKAYEAGKAFAEMEVHLDEFCTPGCKHTPLGYNDFFEWFNLYIEKFNDDNVLTTTEI